METEHEGLATRVPFELTNRILWELLDDFVLVSDGEINEAIRLLAQHGKQVAEGAGAASLAAAFKLRDQLRGKKVVGILSGGNIFVLGEAYAFGVMWSFAMKGLAVLVLRYKQPGEREFRVPLNFKVGNVEIPAGLGLITLALVALCLINLFTKQVATISGVTFTIIFFLVFTISERGTRKREPARAPIHPSTHRS